MEKPCIQSRGYRNDKGYAPISLGQRIEYAHRIAYLLHVGPLQPWLVIDHLCHNEDLTCPGGSTCLHRGCIEPTHLEAVTNSENILRGRATSAVNARRTHCLRGHELTPENCYARPDGKSHRACRTCIRMRQQARYGRSMSEVSA